MTADFGAAVRRLQAVMGGEDPWVLAHNLSEHEGPSARVREGRAAGRRAYEAAMTRRGVPPTTARVYARAIFDDD